MAKFVVAKWQDGAVEAVPQCWITADHKAGFWPSHITERKTLAKAVQQQEKPEPNLWTKLLITKIYGMYDTYPEAIQKTKIMTSKKMQDITSCSDTDANNNGEDGKRRRKIHARKRDNSPDEDVCKQKVSKNSKIASMPPLPLPPVFGISSEPKSLPSNTNNSQAQGMPEQFGNDQHKTRPKMDSEKAAAPGVSSQMIKHATQTSSSSTSGSSRKHSSQKMASSSRPKTTPNMLPKPTSDVPQNATVTSSASRKDASQSAKDAPQNKKECQITKANHEKSHEDIDEWLLSVESENVSHNENTEIMQSMSYTGKVDVQDDMAYRGWVVKSIGTLKLQMEIQSEAIRSIQEDIKTRLQGTENSKNETSQPVSLLTLNVLWDMFPLSSVKEINDVGRRIQKEKTFLHELITLFAALGGGTVKACTDTILERLLSLEAAMQYSWAGGKKKLLFKNTGLFKIILGAVRVTKKDATEFEIKSRICYFLAHAKEKFTRLQNKTKKDVPSAEEDDCGSVVSTLDVNELSGSGTDDTEPVSGTSKLD